MTGWFPLADCESEQRLVPSSELRVVESLWGHYAWGMTRAETDQIDSLAERAPRYMTSR